MKNGVMPKASVVKSPQFNVDDLLKDVKDKNPKCTRCGLWLIEWYDDFVKIYSKIF